MALQAARITSMDEEGWDWFVSFDGIAWMSVTREPTQEDEEAIRALMEGEPIEEFRKRHDRMWPLGYVFDKETGRVRPPQLGKGLLDRCDAEFYTVSTEARAAS